MSKYNRFDASRMGILIGSLLVMSLMAGGCSNSSSTTAAPPGMKVAAPMTASQAEQLAANHQKRMAYNRGADGTVPAGSAAPTASAGGGGQADASY